MKLLLKLLLVLFCLAPFSACALSKPATETVAVARQKLADLPEPTFQTILVAAHDYSALGIELLISKHPEAKVPVKVLAESALSVLTTEQVTMVDLISLSNSLDNIQSGEIKVYLSIGWTLLEINGVIRRNDLTATLTQREQLLVTALFRGILLGTGVPEDVNRTLNSIGPRW